MGLACEGTPPRPAERTEFTFLGRSLTFFLPDIAGLGRDKERRCLMSRTLPPRPDFTQLQHQAKDLLHGHQRKDASACPPLRRLRRFEGAEDDAIFAAPLALHEAQYALAMEYGFASWDAMKRYVEKAAGRPSAVRREEDLTYIAGLERLRFGRWRDCTYGGAVTELLNTIAVPATYEQVMGLSGACYRICMKPDWCPSAGMPQCGYDVERPLYRALGFDVYRIGNEGERRQRVVACIDRGIPVLCGEMRGWPEWGVIAGYADNGRLFYGRTYADYGGAEPDEVFTESRYFLANKYPGFDVQFFDRRCEPLPPRDALKQSFEVCIGTLNQESEQLGYTRGYQAYELWISGLEDLAGFDVFTAGTNGYHLDCLRDARRCAYIYLEQSLGLLQDGNRRRLEKVVTLFKAMYSKLMAVAPYSGTETSFNGRDEDWGMTKREEFANVLRELCGMERQVEAEFRAILAAWD